MKIMRIHDTRVYDKGLQTQTRQTKSQRQQNSTNIINEIARGKYGEHKDQCHVDKNGVLNGRSCNRDRDTTHG